MVGGALSVLVVNLEAKLAFLDAAEAGKVATVQAVLAGAPSVVFLTDVNGATGLHRAVRGGSKEVAEVLLAADAYVNAEADNKETPLHWAARDDSKEAAEVLLAAHADVGAQTKSGKTPLHLAVQYGSMEAAEVLLAAHADVGAQTKSGKTPLHLAAQYGSTEVAEMLLAAQANVGAKTKDAMTPQHLVARDGSKGAVDRLWCGEVEVGAQTRSGKTPLHLAAQYGSTGAAEALLVAHADVDAKAKNEKTPLHLAAQYSSKEVAELLLSVKANVGAKAKDGMTPLHLVARDGSKGAAEVLLCAGAEVDAKNDKNSTPLQVAAVKEHLDLVQLFLRWGASPMGARPSSTRALASSKARRLLVVLDEVAPMAAQERQDAKDAWRAAVGAAATEISVAPPTDSAGRCVADLQAAYDSFLAEPTTLTVNTLKTALTPPQDRNVRWHVLAHRVLLHASRVGLFATETVAEAAERRDAWYDQIYKPLVGVLTPCDRCVVAGLLIDAKKNGLVERFHVAVVGMGLELHTTFYAEIVRIHWRLAGLEELVANAGKVLLDTVTELKGLKQHIAKKEEHDRKVTLAKSAVKIGVSLAPVVGGLLSVSVDVLAEFVVGSTEAAALVSHVVDPTNLAAARQLLSGLQDAEAKFTPVQMAELNAIISPLKSIAEVKELVVDAEKELELAAEADVEDVANVVGDTTSGDEGGGVASDAGSDKWDDVEDTTKEVLIEHGIDEVDSRRHRGASRPTDSSTIPPHASVGAVHAGVGAGERWTSHGGPSELVFAPASPPLGETGLDTISSSPTLVAGPSTAHVAADPVAPLPQSAAAPRPTDDAFFAGAINWTARQVAERLVTYVVRGEGPEREALAAVVTPTAVAQGVTGVSVVRSRLPHELAECLLGDWRSRYGMIVSVEGFIEDVQRVALQQ